MNRSRLVVASATALVGAGLVLAPVAAQAAPAASAASASSSASDARSPITDVSYRVDRDAVVLTVTVDRFADLELLRGGDVVDGQFASGARPVNFVLHGTGLDVEDLGITTRGGGPVVPVRVAFGTATVPKPIEQSTERQIDRYSADALAGRYDQVLRYQALPGATVQVTTNGVTTSGVADRFGIASVPVRFRAGANPQSAVQTLDGTTSVADTTTWWF
ncbi:hypothetical protein [Curtobacterium herbarum]|uniref:Uncharacterized protein n=1 Tax=Curtobacterium herbarum TaxID=150122 RepID=A0ABP4K425_9MICO|nr:hypothetical protein [Curtobacterium herbarum]MBM7474136.1 hypothetical protein [Curtobacterium herbarum]MCS6544540.1 hypothetical protein [Curtobacterium herbarum]